MQCGDRCWPERSARAWSSAPYGSCCRRSLIAKSRSRRCVATSPAPTTPQERAFEGTPGWKEAVIRGRILRPDANGFVLATDNGETGFYPAKIGAGGKIEPDPSVRDVVTPFIGALARCNQLPIGTYQCVALDHGRETAIAQAPIGRPL
jgi:hypothetical protein